MNRYQIEWSFFPDREGHADDWNTEYVNARTIGEALSQFAWRQTNNTDKAVHIKAALWGNYPEE